MGDLAVLGLQFETKGGDLAVRTMDNVARGSREVERASDSMATSQRRARLASDDLAGGLNRADTATAQMARSIMQAERQAIELHRQQQALAGSTRQAAAAAKSAAVDFATMYDAHDQNFAAQYAAGMTRVANSTKLAGFEMLYFGRQLGDVTTMAAMGASPLMILTTQGAQVAEGFAMVSQRGVTVTSVLKQIAASTLALAATLAPFVITIGAVGGAFLLWRKHLDDVAAAIEATTKAQEGQAEGLVSAGEALSKAIAFTEQYGVANDGLSSALDDVLSAQSLSYRETLAGIDPTDRAAKSAAQRAEMERLLAVNILRRAAADAEARASEAADEERKARNTARFDGVMAGIGRAWMGAEMPGSVDPLGAADRVRREAEQRLGVGEKARIATEERRLAEALGAQADAMTKVGLAAKAADIAVQSYSGSSDRAASSSRGATGAIDEQARAYAQLVEDLKTPAEKEIELLHSRMVTLRTEFDLNRISAETYREKFDRLWTGKPELVKAVNAELQQMPEHLKDAEFASHGLYTRFEEILDAARSMQWAIDDVARAIEGRDWMGAFGGLLRAIKQVKDAWGKGGTFEGKVGSVAAIGDMAGQAIGGKGGAAISGIAQGAAMGAAFGPWGAAIGAAIGGLGGILGHDAQKKAAKQQQEAADIARTLALAQEQANRQASLQIQLLRASGDEIGALARERDAEVAAMDRASAAMQRQIWVIQDLQEAVSKAEAALSKAEADLRTVYDREMAKLQKVIDDADVAGKLQAVEQAYQGRRRLSTRSRRASRA